jgi:ketosteroid isomerase-like protein
LDETEDFLGTVLPGLTQADTALHNGDAAPRIAIWSHEDPVTVFGAARTVSGWPKVQSLFESLASQFSKGAYEYEVVASGVSGDLGYIAGIEHTTVSVGGAAPEPYELRVTTILRRENGEWKVVHRHADPVGESARLQAGRIRVDGPGD